MNTRSFLDQARAAKLSPIDLLAHSIWAIVSQSGRAPVTVGEICKMVQHTSGIKPSTYQVRSALEKLVPSDTVNRWVLRHTPVAEVVGYTGGENAIMTLASLVHVFYANETIYEAIHALTWPVKKAAIEVSNNIYNFNQQTDAQAVTEEATQND